MTTLPEPLLWTSRFHQTPSLPLAEQPTQATILLLSSTLCSTITLNPGSRNGNARPG